MAAPASALPLPAVRHATPAGALARRALSLVVVHGILIAGAVFILLPFVWMLITSIKSPSEIFAVDFSLWPKHFNAVENYGRALSKVPLLRFALNGVIVCAGILLVQVLVAVPCAYALAKLRFPGRTALFALVLMGLCIPIQVPALPLYMGARRARPAQHVFRDHDAVLPVGVRDLPVPPVLQELSRTRSSTRRGSTA